MALSFPLSLTAFFDGLRVASCSFDLDEAMEMSRNGNGGILTADVGERLWSGRVMLSAMYNGDAEAVKARLSVLRQAGRSLFVHAYPLYAPASDPAGVAIAASAPQIHTLASNSRELRLSGLPGGLRLRAGECLSFSYLSSPVRYAMHQIVSDVVVADGDGLTPVFEVTPNIRPGAVVGAPVQLVRPFFRAIIVPGSSNAGAAGSLITSGVSFSVLQVLE